MKTKINQTKIWIEEVQIDNQMKLLSYDGDVIIIVPDFIKKIFKTDSIIE